MPTSLAHPSLIPLVSTIFGLTYLALAVGKVPGLRIDRAGIALVGAAAMLACGVLDLHDAAAGGRLRDDRPALRHDGRGRLPADSRGSSPWPPSGSPRGSRGRSPLLAVTIGLSGVLSAFLVNDVVCVALTPLVLRPLPAAEAAADPVPGRPGDGVEHRLGGDDHGQPAEHHHRLALAASPTCGSPPGWPRWPLIGLVARLRGRGRWSTARRSARRRRTRPSPPTSRRGPGCIAGC